MTEESGGTEVPKTEAPKRPVGRHQRLDEIYGEVCNTGEELAGWQQPITGEDRAEIRKMANELLALMNEHEILDTP